jgi:hypothetical protein
MRNSASGNAPERELQGPEPAKSGKAGAAKQIFETDLERDKERP